jgi:hypothetical protein
MINNIQQQPCRVQMDRRGRDLLVQLMNITAEMVSSNPAHGEVYSMQHYEITFVSDLWKVSGFLLFPPQIIFTDTI